MAYTPKHITLISASIGGGHKAAARALEQACEARNIRVSHIDLLDYTNPAFKRLYRDAFIQLLEHAPDAVNAVGNWLDRRPKEAQTTRDRLVARLSRLVSRRLPKAVHELQPDLIIHTHFLAPAILSVTGHLDISEAVVVTDYGAHQLWLQPTIDRYFVATEEMRIHLEAAGVNSERIRITGIPADRRFASLPSKAEARHQLGVPRDRQTLLLMASGLEDDTLRSLLEQLKQLKLRIKVFVICGRTEYLVKTARASLEDYQGLVDIEVLGFVTEMPSYMAAADIIAGKPGGLTTTEALIAGLPFAIVTPYPPQEVDNGSYLLEQGVGLNIDPLTVFGYKLKQLFNDGARLQLMQERTRMIAKPEAAEDIVRSLLEDPLPAPRFKQRYRWLPWKWWR